VDIFEETEEYERQQLTCLIDSIFDKYLVSGKIYYNGSYVQLENNDFKQIKDKVEQLYNKSVAITEIYDILDEELIAYVDKRNRIYYSKRDKCDLIGYKPVYYGCLDDYMESETIFSCDEEIIKEFLDNNL
jgi:hypothetical protein